MLLVAYLRQIGNGGLTPEAQDEPESMIEVTANDLARLFADSGSLMPAAQRSFGMGLLSHLASADQVGLLQAGLAGVVYSKEGGKPEPDGLEGAPYIVNQAGQFSKDGNTYGIGFTIAGASDKPSAEAIIERIASALTWWARAPVAQPRRATKDCGRGGHSRSL